MNFEEEKKAMGALSGALRNKVVDYFNHGDVIRWVGGGRFTYCAIKCSNELWTITGRGMIYGTGQKTYAELIDTLNRSDVSSVEFASSWSAV